MRLKIIKAVFLISLPLLSCSSPENQPLSQANELSPSSRQVRAVGQTWFKPTTEDSGTIRQRGDCLIEVREGQVLNLTSLRNAEAGHVHVRLDKPLRSETRANCEMKSGFLFKSHFSNVTPVTGNKTLPLILMYHDIVASSAAITAADDVPLTRFRAQMDELKAQGFQTISAADLYAYKTNNKTLPAKPVLLTFDDGYIGNITYAFPELEQRGMKATFFVHTNFVGVPTSKDHMSWSDLKTLDAHPLFEVESHTKSHPRLGNLTKEKLTEELAGSQSALENQLGRPIRFLAYPFGHHDSNVIMETQKHYDMAFAVGIATGVNINAYNIPRLGIGASITDLSAFRQALENWKHRSQPLPEWNRN